MKTHRILYNAKCPICSAEIDHYRARASKSAAPLSFEDLNEADLGPWRLTPDEATRRLHALTSDGNRLSGIDAFALIWRNLPGMGWLARSVNLPVLGWIVRLIYDRIAAPFLYWRHRRRSQ